MHITQSSLMELLHHVASAHVYLLLCSNTVERTLNTPHLITVLRQLRKHEQIDGDSVTCADASGATMLTVSTSPEQLSLVKCKNTTVPTYSLYHRIPFVKYTFYDASSSST
jgi:hypothetical protein